MQSLRIKINEEQSVQCKLYKAENSDRVVVIASATGVLQSFYKALSRFLQTNSISVVTFDYSGIGESLEGDIKEETCNAGNWGNRDLNAVLNYTFENFPGHKIVILGHSIGGQLIGLAPSSLFADKIILVAAQSGYWKYWKGMSRVKIWATWYLVFPVVLKVFGYLPSGRFNRMEALPLNVAREWANWCRSKNYLLDFFEKDELLFRKLNCNITSISIEDDFFAPKESVDWLSHQFKIAKTKRLHWAPKDFGVSKIGHFGLFRENFKTTIWEILKEEIKY